MLPKNYSSSIWVVTHIDDKYGIDVDDIHNVSDILDKQFKEQHALKITKYEII
jgi:hypothetical protein